MSRLGRRVWPAFGLLVLVVAAVVLGLRAAAVAVGPGTAALHLALLEDPGAALDLAAVRARDAAFMPASAGRLTPGYSASAWWLRLTLDGPPAGTAAERWLLLRPAWLEQVALWQQQADGRWQVQRAGLSVPHDRWPLDTPVPAFALRLTPGATQTLYLRVASRTAVALDPLLCEPAACRSLQRFELWCDAALLGVALLGVLLLLLLSAALRLPALLWLAGLYTAFTGYELAMHGHAFQLWWPQALDWAPRAMSVLSALSTVCQTLFVLQFLQLRQQLPRCAALLQGLLALLLASLLLGSLGLVAPSLRLSTAIGVSMMALSVLAAWQVWRRGQPQAGFVLAGVAVAALGILPRTLELTGVLPRSALTIYSAQLGLLVYGLVMVAAALLYFRALDRERWRVLDTLLAERAARQQLLEREVALRTEQLRQAQAERSRLLAYIGHDLRAPLAATLQFARRAAAGRSDGAEIELGAVERGVQHQLALIDELVELAHGELGELALEPAPNYLPALLQDLGHEAELLAQGRGNRLLLRLDEDLPPVVVVDAKRLRQVLMNLLSNAAKFCAGGEIVLRADRLPAMAAGQVRLRLTVADDGPGVDEAERALVFEPLRRGRDAADQPGSGLGLAVARRIVAAMGGELTLGARQPQGCVFGFELDLPLAAEREVWRPALQLPSVQAFGRGLCALVVDDDAACRDEWAELLYAAGFDAVHHAAGLAAAREQLQQQTPDLLIVDRLLPDGDGRTLCGPQRSTALRLTTCLLASAMPASAADRRCFDGVLLKPVLPAAALAMVAALLGRSAAAA